MAPPLLPNINSPRWHGILRFDSIVVRSESVRNIIRERRMLEHVNHPFICNLRYSFQDIEYMYVATPPTLAQPNP